MVGKLITLEGIDGSGKSTQVELLATALEKEGYSVVTSLEPGGTKLGKSLRSVFLETEEEVSATAELLLFAADRAQHVDFLINPAIEEGQIVISDRFADATFAYQGAGRGFDEETVNTVIEIATRGRKPDLTLFLDLSVEAALGRASGREANNRMDSETVEFYERVRASYLEIARREPERFVIIDGDREVVEISRDLISLVLEYLDEKDV